MDREFQLSLLSYLVQSPTGVNYIEVINDETFDLVEYKFTSQLLKRFYKLHSRLPGKLEASAFLDDEIKRTTDLPERVAKELREVFEDLYYPLDERDIIYIEDQLINNLQDRKIESSLAEYAKGDITSKELFKKLESVSVLTLPGEDDIYKDSGFLIADIGKHADDQIQGNPTFLNDLNKLTAAGGFYSPQLIVFMSGPKHFKTGILLKIALEYMKSGYNVYYADIENGTRSIRNRLKMAVAECELKDIYDSDVKSDIEYNLQMAKHYFGGDIFIDNYPAYTKTVKDVENRLSYLSEKFGFVPDVIFWDPVDKFIPISQHDQKRDERIKSQKVYHEAINLNKKLDCFGFTPSQVNRAAIDKKVFSMKDIAEDFGRVMIAHGVFAICATPEELEEGIRRIIPVAQREGVGYKGKNQCLIKIDESRMIVQEAVDENERVDDA